MLLTLKAKIISALITLGVITVLIIGAYYYIKNKNDKIAELQGKVLTLNQQVDSLNKTIKINKLVGDLNIRLGQSLDLGLKDNKKVFNDIEKELNENYDNAQDSDLKSKVLIDSIWKSYEASIQ